MLCLIGAGGPQQQLKEGDLPRSECSLFAEVRKSVSFLNKTETQIFYSKLKPTGDFNTVVG